MKYEIEFALMENGLDFLLYSLKDLQNIGNDTNNDKNTLKYSILHLSAAIEILFKIKLDNSNWTYVFADMNRADLEKYKSRKFVSLSSEETMKRLEKLLAISFDEKDKKVLKRVREVRNCLEHFDFKANSKALENDIYKAVKILLQFITGNLLEFCSGDNENALLSQIKTEVARLDLHYQSLLKLAHEHMEKNGITKEDVVTCPECLEETFSIEESDKNYHVCYFCGWNGNTNSDNIRIANAFIEKRMGSSYSVIKDGGEWPQYFCPECGEYTWVVMKDFSKCLNCCEDFYGRTKICDSCGSPFATSDDESDICESCWEYKFSKD